MATKDFLSKGINSIEYSNGAMVNVAAYAEMAIRTANKRDNLFICLSVLLKLPSFMASNIILS